MRETVHRETKLTVSAGIAPNKVRSARAVLSAHVRLIYTARVSDARKGNSFCVNSTGALPNVDQICSDKVYIPLLQRE